MKTKLYFLIFILYSASFVGQEIRLIKDILPGVNPSRPQFFKAFNNNVYFSTSDKTYISDGTETGTVIASSEFRASEPNKGVAFNGSLFFPAEFGSFSSGAGKELCAVNDTFASLIRDVKSGNSSSGVANLMTTEEQFFFTANDGTHGTELWVSDGTTAETNLVKDINIGTAGSGITNIVAYNGLVYFAARTSNTEDEELWQTDGTEVGTIKIPILIDNKTSGEDIVATDINNLVVFNEELYFSAVSDDIGRELWAYNSTTNTSRIVKDVYPGLQGSTPANFIELNGELLFTSLTAANRGNELFKTDGTTEGTVKVKTISNAGSGVVYANTYFKFNDKIYFAANAGLSTYFLFSTDGTTSGTVKVEELDDNVNTGLDHYKPIVYNNKIYLRKNNSNGDTVIFETNGNPFEATEIITGVFTGDYSPLNFTVANNTLFFTADHPSYGIELFSLTTINSDNYTQIPDPAFEQKLILMNVDDTLDGQVLTANISGLIDLDLNNEDVRNMQGIEAFVSLENLNLFGNSELTTLDISNLDALKNLNISSCNFSTINFPNANLEVLECENNGATSIDISNNILLKELFANNNLFTSINTTDNEEVLFLGLNENNITGTFDVSSNRKLEALYINNNNNLTTLDLSTNTLLEELWANNNALTNLDLSAHSVLETIFVSNNQLETLNIQNGNNANIRIENGTRNFSATNNPNLTCIQVDDETFANVNFTSTDSQTSFNTNCNSVGGTFVPDDVFEQALIDLGLDNILDDYVLTENINGLEILDISNGIEGSIGIEDLTGLQNFVSLTELDISNNSEISALDITPFTNLEILKISNCNFSTINFPSTTLKELECQYNGAESIDISNNPNLTRLSARDNLFTTINTTNNPELTYLALHNNVIETIDVSSNLKLVILIIPSNKIRLLDVTNNSLLRELLASRNELAEMDLSNNGALRSIFLDENQLTFLNFQNENNSNTFGTSLITINNPNLTCIQVDNVEYAVANFTNVDDHTAFSTNCSNIGKVNIPDNNFEQALIDENLDDDLDGYISKSDVENIETLELYNTFSNTNKITDLTGIENFTNLKNLFIDNQEIKNVDLSANENLEQIFIKFSEVETIVFPNSDNLRVIDCRSNTIKELNLGNNPGLKTVICNKNILTEIDTSGLPNLEELYCDENDILSIDLRNNQEIKKIDCSSNSIGTLNLYENTKLESLDCNYNEITILDIATLVNLKELRCSYNEITVLDASNNRNLEILFCVDNNISSLNIDKAGQLKELFCGGNQLTTLDVNTNIELEKLSAHFNLLTNLDVSNNTKLKELNCNGNSNNSGISSLDVSNNTLLTKLSCGDNNLTNLDIVNNTLLEEVHCHNTLLTSLNVSNNFSLTYLDCRNNGLTELDVTKNRNLEVLTCQENSLSVLNVSNNRLLEDLNMSYNNIAILDIANNFRLEYFQARNTNLTCINVWDVDYANVNWSNNIDDTVSFGDSCYTEIPDTNFEQELISDGFDTVLDGYILTSIAQTTASLNLQSANIRDLTGIQDFTALTYLHLKGNNLESIDISNNPLLTYLSVSDNPSLNRLDISNNTQITNFEALETENLTCIQVWGLGYAINSWSDKIDEIASFSLDCNDVWTIEVDEKTQTILDTIPGLDADGDGNITIAEAESFTKELDLSDKGLEDVKGLQAFSKVKKLNLSGNNIDDLSPLTRKKITLVSKTTGKKREVVAKVSELETLIISNNTFETLNLEDLTGLKEIIVSDNPNLVTMSIKNGNNANITSFDATNTPNLTCILVDDTNASYLNNFTKGTKSNFVADLTDCRSKVLSTNEFLQKDINVFPNPVTDQLTIQSVKTVDFVEVYNAIGKRVFKTKMSKIDFSNFTSGIYFIKIISDDTSLTKRIIKK